MDNKEWEKHFFIANRCGRIGANLEIIESNINYYSDDNEVMIIKLKKQLERIKTSRDEILKTVRELK